MESECDIEMSTVITEPAVDVVCLGLGQMSGPVAAELSLAGFSVVGLEKGPYWQFTQDWTEDHVHDEWGVAVLHKFDHPLYISSMTFRNNANQMALVKRRYNQYGDPVVGHGVGGAATHFGAQMMRMSPWAYQAYSNLMSRYGSAAVADMLPPNSDLEDWPLTYNDYVPYYEQWEQAIGLSGTNQDPYTPGITYPLPPHPSSAVGTLFQNATESMGYNPFPWPNAIVSAPYMNQYGVTRNVCVYCGFCWGNGGDSCFFQCETGAKSSSHVTTIPAAIASGNFQMPLNVYASRINLDSTTGLATSVTYYDLATGDMHIQPTSVVFTGLWGHNNIRMFQTSGIGNPYNATTVTGQVGRAQCTSGSLGSASAAGTLNIGGNRYGGNGFGGFEIEDFKNDNFDHTGQDFISGTVMGQGRYLGGGPKGLNLYSPTAQSFGSSFKATLVNYDLPTKLSITLGTGGAVVPQTDWFVDLDPHYNDIFGDPLVRITGDYGMNPTNASNFLVPYAGAILTKMGCTDVTTKTATASETTGNNQDAMHPHCRGGMRVGTNSSTAALNQWNQSWQVANVFAAGEITDTWGDESSSGTHIAGPQAYVAAEGIKMYLANPGPLV